MMNKPVLLLALLFSVLFSAQNLEWKKNRKLTWLDFHSDKKSEHHNSVAYAFTGITYEVTRTSRPDSEISILIKAIFDPSRSWKKVPDPGSYLLHHEQLHFDITEVFVRKIRKMISEKIKKSSDYELYFQPEYHRIYDEYYAFQKKYDLDTHHSVNRPMQEEYNRLVTQMLEDLEAYQYL